MADDDDSGGGSDSGSSGGGGGGRLMSKLKGSKSKINVPGYSGGAQVDVGPKVRSYHKGGKVRKTGLARLKKGELVLTKRQAAKRKKTRRSKSR